MPSQIPPECTGLESTVNELKNEVAELQDELRHAAGEEKSNLTKVIKATNLKLGKAQEALAACVKQNKVPVFGTAPPATRPTISPDNSPVSKTKTINLDFLQRKFDEFFNKRTDPPIFKLRFHHNTPLSSDSPGSDAEIFFIDAEKEYKSISYKDLGQLDHGYYFNDINSNFVNVHIFLSNPAPLEVTFSFETGGDTEMPSTSSLSPDMNFLEFNITVRFTLNFDLKNGKVDLLSWVADLKDNVKITTTVTGRGEESVTVRGTFLGTPINETVPYILWDDLFDKLFIQKIVRAHIVTERGIDPGGATQKRFRKKIFDALKDPGDPANNKTSTRDQINRLVNQWLLGGDGSYKITQFSKNDQALVLSYIVPKNIINPFPAIPADWPSAANPHSNPRLDFSPSTLANIDHIVVLTMENRSFDQMLGYLSLPVDKGGMGRADVDGLKGGEFNPYISTNYPSFPFAPRDTKFAPDPAHGYEPVFHQINGGQMNGFVRSFAEEAVAAGGGPRIMGYHTAANVPVYDALARDFALSHRWFAAHPGPTFCNRFYELTGRLNLTSGLNPDPKLAAGTWEFSNSSPLTPVFTQTVFDFLTDYQHIDPNISWHYYEHGYCFLRFFEKYTFDSTNIIDANDPVNGFFANAARGTLPSVTFIDPHFIELPPNANCDGPPADVADGQALVQKIVEAVVAGPKWHKTLLIIIYDEHGGFYDHVPPPQAVRVTGESPITTYGIRVPAFVISPWVQAGQVFGHGDPSDGTGLFFDHTSILKTIARRFMSDFPPYMSERYAAANDLSSVLGNTPRQTQFLPFIRYNLMYAGSKKMLGVQDGNSLPGTKLLHLDKTGAAEQDFSFENAGDGLVYIRTHCGNLYLTVDVPDIGRIIVEEEGSESPNTTRAAPPPQPLGIKQDIKYKSRTIIFANNRFNPAYQKWKVTPAGIAIEDRNLYVISNAFFPDKVLQPVNVAQSGVPVVLGDKSPSGPIAVQQNAWKITSPLISNEIVNRL